MRIAILSSPLILLAACHGPSRQGASSPNAIEEPVPVTTVVASSLQPAPAAAAAPAASPAVMNDVPSAITDSRANAPSVSVEKVAANRHRVQHIRRAAPKHRNPHGHEVFRSAGSPE